MESASQTLDRRGSRSDPNETAILQDTPGLRENPFGLLEHRVATAAINAREALPGHYVAVHDGDGVAHLIPLRDAITHVGRAVGSDLRFDDVHVSRRHAIIVRYGDHVRVLDDRSSAGTFVNGQRIVATDLLDGDLVRIGPVAFTYRHIR
ncbi:FHA domain-containing protein [Conexibacter sp. DBS9H8]|uniref:FHA domain-containing protein n=1 Tax=Conexibacter sp. DBS9H8 TaxID=2937801 RepID=UPI00200D3310|nr:FHA domain-containing protein [Conexibacter sp. DBS9H8]